MFSRSLMFPTFQYKRHFFTLVFIVGFIIDEVVVTCTDFFKEFTHGYHMLGDETVLLC